MRTTTLAVAAGLVAAATGQSTYTPAQPHNPKKELRIWIEASARASAGCGLGLSVEAVSSDLSNEGGEQGRAESGRGHPRRGLNSLREPACDPKLALNVTSTELRREFWDAVDRCPNPWYSVREIRPDHVSWSKAPPMADNAAKTTKGAGPNADDASATGAAHEATDNATATTAAEAEAAAAEAVAGDRGAPGDADGAVKPASFLAFLLYLDHDAFSDELVEVVDAVAPAFPNVMFVKVRVVFARPCCMRVEPVCFVSDRHALDEASCLRGTLFVHERRGGGGGGLISRLHLFATHRLTHTSFVRSSMFSRLMARGTVRPSSRS